MLKIKPRSFHVPLIWVCTSMHINGYWVRERLTHWRGSKIFVMSQSPRKTWEKACIKLSSMSIRSFTAYLLLISLCSNYLEIKSPPNCGILANSFPRPFSSTVRQRQWTTALRTMGIKRGKRTCGTPERPLPLPSISSFWSWLNMDSLSKYWAHWAKRIIQLPQINFFSRFSEFYIQCQLGSICIPFLQCRLSSEPLFTLYCFVSRSLWFIS